ncbi:MAG: isoleucine--tRNA ligase [Candidatus Dojkabacteria bacterium]
MEKRILAFWKERDILNKSIKQRPANKTYTFYDGPITANGEPHTGHMLTFSLKDLFPRYWTMRGFRVDRSLGWDCHGIPVEYEVEKKLGFKEKKDIERFGIAEFNKLCKESVEKYQANIIELEEKMGRLTNSEEEYATMDKNFIESVWWSLKTLYEKGLIYEGFKVVPYSTRAGTTLSNAEVALGGYQPIIDPAITVEFRLKEDENVRVLAWTTTPWTIPSNLALAVGKDIKYVQVKVENSDKEFIVAKDLAEAIFPDAFSVVRDLTAEDLVGKEYIPPFDFFIGRANAHRIYEGFHVTTESGTGIVHLAPYGAEDNEIFQQVGIESFDVLDEQGDFTNEIEPYFGQNYREANANIIRDLEEKGLLFKHEDYEHDMPICWRTKTPLIYKPITSWYIAMSTLRKELVDNNNKINWIPNHAKDGRFGNWLAEIKDWCISRKRYWGTPLPIWKSDSGKVLFIGSYEELEKYSGQKIDDPHRPFIDEVEFDFEGEHYKRIPDVIDVWYDSGAMPFARFHYPFENKDKFENKFPAEYIAEGIDQTRGWFYSLHAIATAIFNSNAYNNVVINGTIVDAQKRKLSKSLGNYTPPLPTIEKFGADTVRMNFFSTPLMQGEDTTIDDNTLKAQKQEFILPLWNIFSFFTTYANMHNWKPRQELVYNARNITEDSHPWDHIPFDDIENSTDAWLLALLQNTIKEVNDQMENYIIPKAIKSIQNFVTEISKWYIRSNRERFTLGDQRALDVLYYVIIETIKLLAPFAPFISEEIYQKLVVEELDNQKESVHLCDYPIHDQNFINEYEFVLDEMEIVRKIAEMGHNLRVENGLKVRQPLPELLVSMTNTTVSKLADWMKDMLRNELNVKEVSEKIFIDVSENIKVVEDSSFGVKVGLNTEISKELKMEGIVRDLARQIQSLRKNMHLQMHDEVNIQIEKGIGEIEEVVEKYVDELRSQTRSTNIELVESLNSDFNEIKINNSVLKIKIYR